MAINNKRFDNESIYTLCSTEYLEYIKTFYPIFGQHNYSFVACTIRFFVSSSIFLGAHRGYK